MTKKKIHSPLGSQKGNALVVLMCIVMLLSALMFLFVGRTGAEIRQQRISTCAQQARWEANGQMNIAMFKISNAAYDINGHNQVLHDNADTGNPIPGTTVYVTSIAGTEGWYRLEARVMSGSNLHRVRMNVCERDSMARFSQLCFLHSVDITESIGGDIHSNYRVHFWGEDLVLPGNVTSAGGFRYYNGSESDVIVQQTLQDYVGTINHPDFFYALALGVEPYVIDTDGGYAEIKLQKDTIKIKVNGSTESHYPMPANGAILVFGTAYIEGELNGRLTVFCWQDIKITGNLRYVDSNNKTAYLNGTRPDLDYVPNPDYTGESCLGLVAAYNIEIASCAPNSIEVNAATYAVTGHVGIEGYGVRSYDGQFLYCDCGFQKNSIRHLGLIISNEKSVYGIYFFSAMVSGFTNRKLVYDYKAGLRPPPHFPWLQRPHFSGWEAIR